MFNSSTLRVGVILLLVLLALPTFAQNNNNPWQDISEFTLNESSADRQIIPEKYRTVSLEGNVLKEILDAAPLRHTPAAEATEVRLSLPMPDGTIEEFRIVDAPIMAPGLATKYPAIHAYAGQGIDDPTAYVRFGVTQKGFHAMILSARHSTVFIDAYAKNNTENYISYYRSDYTKRLEDDFSCHTEGETKQEAAQKTVGENLFKAGGDCQLRTYRLALACTQEYASFHGGTVASVLAEYNIAMARVNGVYETDFAVTMTLVDNTDEIIYLSEPDPFTNNNGGTMLGQNQTTCDTEIGSANYDIGHVFSTGGGGIAGLGVPCRNNQKARGVTGLGSPVNDPFYIDYVAHEMGHQFGANHTFNNNCGGQRNNATAMEPGSASTIMGYAGICAPNVQSNSDPYFHAASLNEVYIYITTGSGSGCPSVINNPNAAPTITVENTNYTIPGGTPFELTATATDPDGDALTYCWEQMDNEISTQAPQGGNTGGPNFRSLNPTESPTRHFPSLDNIINGTNDTWEVLPTVTRDMEFRCVVRDNNMGEGCTDEIDVNIDVDGDAGPFLVTNPNTSVTWMVGENQNITWDVANTDQAPVSCANVDILLSLDGGNTYPITLAENVPNTGSNLISVPNNATTTARVKVICSDNIFYDISNQNFVIEEPTVPTFVFAANPSTVSACNDATASFSFDFTSLAGFGESVSLTTSGLPTGAMANFSTNPITPSGTSTLTISNLNGLAAGDYTITVNANSASVSNSTTITLSLSAGIPTIQSLTAPANNQVGVELFAGLSWTAVAGATNYNVVVSTTANFAAGTIVFDEDVTENTITTTELNEETIYYWQVNATSACGTGSYSSSSAFQTGAVNCETFASTDIPVLIPSNAAGTITSTLEIPAGTIFSDIDVNVFIRHTYAGDLGATLTSPSGTEVSLFAEPGVPASQYGCNNDDIDVTLDDDAANTAEDFENECGGSIPTISGTYQPIDALSVFNGEPAGGTWTLTVSDAFGEDGGQLDTWSIFGCSADAAAPTAPSLSSSVLNVPQGGTEGVTNAFLQASAPNNTPAQLTFTVLTLPTNGSLTLNGITLVAGMTFTQADINSGALSYTHDGSATMTDSFNYGVTTVQGGWVPESTFNINVVQNSLSASAVQQMSISCNGEANGSIVVSSTGGNMPLSYSIDGVNFQASNEFTGLTAGSYTIIVRDDFSFEVTTNGVTIANPTAITATNIVSDDMITVDANGGTGALTYSIDGINYQASNIFTGLANGTYSVCVKDANDCETCKNETIAVNNVSASAAITTTISCSNENDGVITVTASGGNEPYTYSINGGTPQGSNVFSFLPSNDYTITVQDNDGFTVTTSTVTLTNPDQIISTPSVDGSDITVNASGGTGTLMYSSDGGMTYQASNIFTGLENGTYTICTQDANDCTDCDDVTVAVNNVSASAAITTAISCSNENDGVITVTASGGNEPYTYSINGGTPQGSNVFSFLPSNDYTITVQDNDGFTVSTNTVTLINPDEIISTPSVNGSDITVNASGGTGALTHSIDGVNYQASNIFTGLANGSYTVCTRDANGCIECDNVVVAVNMMVAGAVLTNDISCNNENDGTITVNAAGGAEPYTYSINGGTPQDSNIFGGLSADTYTVTVQDNDGFTLMTNSVIVSNPTALDISNTVTVNEITVTATGGTGALTYTIDGIIYQAANVFFGLANGSYDVCVRDENDCEVCSTALIAVNGLVVNASLTSGISCNNESDATITVAAAGGNEPYTYSLNGGTPQDSNIFEGLSADTYTVTVQDNDGFALMTNSVVITNPTAIEISNTVAADEITVTATGGTGTLTYTIDGIIYQASNVFFGLANGSYNVCARDENDCEVCSTALIAINGLVVNSSLTSGVSCNDESDATITVSAAGGNEPYSYSLNGTETAQESNVFTSLSAGMYFVQVTDNDGFVLNTNTLTIDNPTAVTAMVDIVDFTVTINANGGTPGYQYSTNGTNYVNNNIFIFDTNGTYTLFVQDANDCVTSVEAQVGVNQITVNASVQTPLACNDDEDGCISVTASNTVAPVQYEVGGVVQTDNGIFCGLSAGDYTVNITDAAGFMASTSITIGNPQELNFEYLINCDLLTTSVGGGTGELVTTLNGVVIEPEINILNGEYTLQVEDANGCTISEDITIDNIESAELEVEPSDCFGENDGTLTVSSIEGGTADYEYSIDNGTFQSSNTFEGLAPDTYEVTIRDAEGCETTATATVTEPVEITVSTTTDGNSIIVTASGGTGEFTYSIDGQNFQDENVFLDLPSGLYTVTIVDENDCSTTIETEFLSGVNDELFDLEFAVNPNPNNGSFNLLVNMPTERDLIVRVFDVAGKEIFRDVYVKNSDFFTQNINLTNLAAGSYFVTVNDGYLAGTKEIVVIK